MRRSRDRNSVLENARWALATAWETNRFLTTVFIGLQTVQGVLPAGQALATRGLINAAVGQVRTQSGGLRPMVPWLLLAFIVTIAEGFCHLLQDFTSRRLEDDLNLELNGALLSHAARLDVGFFEDPASEDMLYIAKQSTARSLLRFVSSTLSLFSNLLQMVSLLAVRLRSSLWSWPWRRRLCPTCGFNGSCRRSSINLKLRGQPSAAGRSILRPR
jgi:ABC-type bacteriocin/lantibiotic exporter with double-glycine peptidase domain